MAILRPGRSIAALVALALLAAPGCRDSSSSSPGAGGAGSAASAAIGTGPLALRAARFEGLMQAQHTPNGLAQDVRLDASGAVASRGGPSRCLWTGVYAATQAARWRVTRDPAAHAAMERSLWALHDLHAITGMRGVICRGFDEARFEPNGLPASGAYAGMRHDANPPSRDQYTGWFFGLALAFDEVADPALRAALRDDCRAIADLLIRDDLAPDIVWNGAPETLFDLDPTSTGVGRITAQEWARIDDFPLNLVVRAVPYDPQIAASLASVTLPPIRAGEAVLAVMFFTVAAHVTGDAGIRAHRDALLYGPRDFARVIDLYATLQDDALHGRNMPAVRAILTEFGWTLAQLVDIWLQAQGRSALVRAIVQPLAGSVFQWVMGRVADAVAFLADPANRSKVDELKRQLGFAAAVLRIAGLQGAATAIEGFLATYGPHLDPEGLRDLAGSMRAYTGQNFGFLATAAILEVETDPAIRAIFQGVHDRNWSYTAEEGNAWFNLIHAAYGSAAGPLDVPDALASLRIYPDDLGQQSFDNSSWPGLRVSIWPDRFGRVGGLAAEPVAFPVDRRERHIWPWQGHPRQIVHGGPGANPDQRAAPLGFLGPYWLARRLGVLGPGD